MKILREIRNYFCYCGIEKEEYKAIKKDAYVSNFAVWRILHCFMSVAFTALFINSCFSEMMRSNRIFYMIFAIYSIAITVIFFILKKDSLLAQLLIYLSISMLFVFGGLVTQNKPDVPATAFFVFLIITPMFMLDKPYFMMIELTAASVIFSIWMYYAKPYDVWQMDLINACIYLVVGIVIHIVANSLRIKEFVLTRKISIQKDTDELTGIKNKAALTREINTFLADKTNDKGIMLMLDINHFKSINDTYGHDVGDLVIRQTGELLNDIFKDGEVVGRFGGDEFIIFIKDKDDTKYASDVAMGIINGLSEKIVLPDANKKVRCSIGITIYHGLENNYSEVLKKADVALYKAKSDQEKPFSFYE